MNGQASLDRSALAPCLAAASLLPGVAPS